LKGPEKGETVQTELSKPYRYSVSRMIRDRTRRERRPMRKRKHQMNRLSTLGHVFANERKVGLMSNKKELWAWRRGEVRIPTKTSRPILRWKANRQGKARCLGQKRKTRRSWMWGAISRGGSEDGLAVGSEKKRIR